MRNTSSDPTAAMAESTKFQGLLYAFRKKKISLQRAALISIVLVQSMEHNAVNRPYLNN